MTGDRSGLTLLAAFTAVAFVLFVLPRIALMLPAIALERDLDPWESWRATGGNTLRLGFAGVLCLLPIGLAVMYLERTLHIPKLIVTPFASVLGALVITISITLLSLAFDFFIRHRDCRTQAV